MKKKILCVLALVLVVSLTGCGINRSVDDNNYTNTIPSTTAPTSETDPPATETTTSANNLSFTNYMERLNEYAKKQKVVGVTNLRSSEAAANPNMITYSCDYAGGLIHLNITTENGKVAHILSTVSPYALIERGECANISDAEVTAHALTLVPIWWINENWNYDWHARQYLNAPEQGSSTSSMRTYTKDNWSFTVNIGSALVSVSALDNSIS